MTYLHCLQHSLFEHLFNLFYLDTLLIGHTFCSMVSILSKFTLQKELHVQHFMTNNVFGQKSKTTTKQKSKQQSLSKTGIEPGTSRIAV